MNDFNANIRITKFDDGVLATAGFSTEEIARFIVLNRGLSQEQILQALKPLEPKMWVELDTDPRIIEWEREAFARGWAPRPYSFQSLLSALYDLGKPRGYMDSECPLAEYPAMVVERYRVVVGADCVDGPHGYCAFWDAQREEMRLLLKHQKRIWDLNMERFMESGNEGSVIDVIRVPRGVDVIPPVGGAYAFEVSSSKEDSDSVSPSGFSRGCSPFGSAVGGIGPEGETGPYTPEKVQRIADAFENLAEFSDEYKLRGSQMRSIASGVEVTLVCSHDSRHEDDIDQRRRNRQVAEAILDVLKLAIPAQEEAEHVEKN